MAVLATILFAACAGPPTSVGHYKVGKAYKINGRWYQPVFDPAYDAEGVASWYGPGFHGRPTANGERYDQDALTAAHTTLPLPSIVRVTSLENGRSVIVRVNDRGPFVDDRIIDLSRAGARALGFERQGLARVRVEFLRLAEATGTPPVPEPPAVAVASAETLAPVCTVRAVDVGAYPEREQATLVRRQLAGSIGDGVGVVLVPSDTDHKVRVGPLRSSEEAEKTLIHLKRIGYDTATLLKADSNGRRCS
ncbi:MAG: septal ring lytic transglycosylase RlpA family protein [Geminicoccaceae bacterium]